MTPDELPQRDDSQYADITAQLERIQPKPGERFYHRMANAPWFKTQSQGSTSMSIEQSQQPTALNNQRPRPRLPRRTLLPLLAALVFGGSLAAVGGWVALQRFGLVLTDSTHWERPPDLGVPPGGQIYSGVVAPVTLEEAQAQVPFPILLPTLLPEGLTLRSTVGVFDQAAVLREQGCECPDPMPINVDLYFTHDGEDPGPETASLQLGIVFHSQGGGVEVPDAATEDVKVKDLPAVYVHGSWQPTTEGDFSEMDWHNEADIAMLSWKKGELTYRLTANYLGLEADDLIQIAESIPSQ